MCVLSTAGLPLSCLGSRRRKFHAVFHRFLYFSLRRCPHRARSSDRKSPIEHVRTVYIGDYFEAELSSGTTFPVFVPDLDNVGLPHKLYLTLVMNGSGTITPQPTNPGNGFFFTHPIRPNQSAITWRIYYTAGQRVAMRVSHGPTTDPYTLRVQAGQRMDGFGTLLSLKH